MTDGIAIGLALLPPWALGTAFCYWLTRPGYRTGRAIALGQGFVLGLFFATGLLRLFSGLGLTTAFWLTNGALVAAAALLAWIHCRKAAGTSGAIPGPHLLPWQRVVIGLFLALLAWRYLTLAQELLLRPLFAWDAWMNWAPKAVVWFHQDKLVPFVSPEAWLTGERPDAYTLGNYKAWKYPETVPLIQLWGMLALGSHDNSAIYLPWLLLPLALGLAMYGHLRSAGLHPLGATLAAYGLLSLPYLNVHTALPGYADIWVASALGMAAFNLFQWERRGHWHHALLCALFALLCSQLKMPGIALAGIIGITMVRQKLALAYWLELALLAVLVLLGLALYLWGVDLQLPGLGRVAISRAQIEVPVFGVYDLQFQNVTTSLFRTLARMPNWHLLFYLLCGVTACMVWRRQLVQRPSSLLFLLFVCTLFILLPFYFTELYRAAMSFVTLNRAMLYLIPPLVFYLAITARRLRQMRRTGLPECVDDAK